MMAASLTVGAPFAGVRPCQKPCSRASGRGALVCRAQAQGEANIKASTSAGQLALYDQKRGILMIDLLGTPRPLTVQYSRSNAVCINELNGGETLNWPKDATVVPGRPIASLRPHLFVHHCAILTGSHMLCR